VDKLSLIREPRIIDVRCWVRTKL